MGAMRPIDIHTLIPRSGEISRVQHLQQQQPDLNQQQFAAALREQVEHRHQQVHGAKGADGPRVSAEGHGSGTPGGKDAGERQRGSGGNDPGRPEEPEAKEPGKGRRLDLRI